MAALRAVFGFNRKQLAIDKLISSTGSPETKLLKPARIKDGTQTIGGAIKSGGGVAWCGDGSLRGKKKLLTCDVAVLLAIRPSLRSPLWLPASLRFWTSHLSYRFEQAIF